MKAKKFNLKKWKEKKQREVNESIAEANRSVHFVNALFTMHTHGIPAFKYYVWKNKGRMK